MNYIISILLIILVVTIAILILNSQTNRVVGSYSSLWKNDEITVDPRYKEFIKNDRLVTDSRRCMNNNELVVSYIKTKVNELTNIPIVVLDKIESIGFKLDTQVGLTRKRYNRNDDDLLDRDLLRNALHDDNESSGDLMKMVSTYFDNGTEKVILPIIQYGDNQIMDLYKSKTSTYGDFRKLKITAHAVFLLFDKKHKTIIYVNPHYELTNEDIAKKNIVSKRYVSLFNNYRNRKGEKDWHFGDISEIVTVYACPSFQGAFAGDIFCAAWRIYMIILLCINDIREDYDKIVKMYEHNPKWVKTQLSKMLFEFYYFNGCQNENSEGDPRFSLKGKAYRSPATKKYHDQDKLRKRCEKEGWYPSIYMPELCFNTKEGRDVFDKSVDMEDIYTDPSRQDDAYLQNYEIVQEISDN